MKLYYMHDCHLFSPLPTDSVEAALAETLRHFDGGSIYGMLCGIHNTKENIPDVCHAGPTKNRVDFIQRATAWLSQYIGHCSPRMEAAIAAEGAIASAARTEQPGPQSQPQGGEE